jgi:hypothetical protein
MLGVYVDPTRRKLGLSKLFLGIWMHLSLLANLTPITGVIQKPLLALALQHTFQYQPLANKGVDAQVSRGESGDTIVLYSSSLKSLEGAFSPRDVKREGLVFSMQPTNGRVVRIGAPFEPPSDASVLQGVVDQVLQTNGDSDYSLQMKVTPDDLRRVLLGQ